MVAFYQGAVRDWFVGAGAAMVAPAPGPAADRAAGEFSAPTHRDAIENPYVADAAMSYARAMDLPCSVRSCDCPGCYDCSGDPAEACGCVPDQGWSI
jgi:hypothetical protein